MVRPTEDLLTEVRQLSFKETKEVPLTWINLRNKEGFTYEFHSVLETGHLTE